MRVYVVLLKRHKAKFKHERMKVSSCGLRNVKILSWIEQTENRGMRQRKTKETRNDNTQPMHAWGDLYRRSDKG